MYEYRLAKVTRVVDGDTVELRQLGKVRVIGADTPEVHGGRECFGTEASAYTERRLRPGTTVEGSVPIGLGARLAAPPRTRPDARGDPWP